MYHTNCDDAQTDQSLFWSNFPQMNISGKQNQSQKRCEASDVSNAQTDVKANKTYTWLAILHVYEQHWSK